MKRPWPGSWLFGVGLHFSPKDLLAVRRVAVPGALMQAADSTVLGTIIGLLLGWSLLLNPLLFAAKDRLKPQLGPKDVAATPTDPEPVRIVGEQLHTGKVPLSVIDESAQTIDRIRMRNFAAVAGNAADEAIVRAANVARARFFVVAIPNGFEAGQIVQQARRANPAISILARAHYDAEVDHLQGLGANQVIMGEREIAHAMLETVKGAALRRDGAAGSADPPDR